jgi:hypothetical protein
MDRVLKPDGVSVHFIECDPDNWWTRQAKRWPSTYCETFIIAPGHTGLLKPTWIADLWWQDSRIEVRGTGGTIPEIGLLSSQFADREWRGKLPAWMAALVWIDRVLAANMFVREALNILLEPIARFFDRDIKTCSAVMIAYRKRWHAR